ncbi:MAG: hypothetical protein QOH74_48, partial [Gaiellales bacterium]|nr:hypothetical protein [Gaiellales bacterium]
TVATSRRPVVTPPTDCSAAAAAIPQARGRLAIAVSGTVTRWTVRIARLAARVHGLLTDLSGLLPERERLRPRRHATEGASTLSVEPNGLQAPSRLRNVRPDG